MIGKLKEFVYLEPSTLSEAISLLEKYNGKAKILAGGTDLVVQMKQRKLAPEFIINIKNISELNFIKYDKKVLRIGALVTHHSIANSSIVRENFGVLADAVLSIGVVQTRNVGTVVGNICNASPSADTSPALIALDAKLKVVNPEGEKIIKIEDFFTGPFTTILKSNELLTEIQIPDPRQNSGGSYAWAPKATAVDETLVGVAVLIAVDLANSTFLDTRIVMGSVAPIPMRAKRAEEFLKGEKIAGDLLIQAGEIAADEASPRSREEYRRSMVKVFVKRALYRSLEKIRFEMRSL